MPELVQDLHLGSVDSYIAFTPVSGTTANDYLAEPYTWVVMKYSARKTIEVYNSHATNSLTYRISYKPSPSDATEIGYRDNNQVSFMDKVLGPTVSDVIEITRDMHTLLINVKSTATDSHATYKIFCTGRR